MAQQDNYKRGLAAMARGVGAMGMSSPVDYRKWDALKERIRRLAPRADVSASFWGERISHVVINPVSQQEYEKIRQLLPSATYDAGLSAAYVDGSSLPPLG